MAMILKIRGTSFAITRSDVYKLFAVSTGYAGAWVLFYALVILIAALWPHFFIASPTLWS